MIPEHDAEAPSTPDEATRLVVDVEGFEGPLDMLLEMARSQKVDLTAISVLQLAEQYLAFVDRILGERLEIAADHLVMAAWLTYLKSRLLLPKPDEDEEPTGEEMAAALAFRLKRLEAMRTAASALMERSLLGRDVFGRGGPAEMVVERRSSWQASLFDMLDAYAGQLRRNAVVEVTIGAREVWSLPQARELLIGLVGDIAGWTPIDRLLGKYLVQPELRRTARASSLSAGLELVREGRMDMRQARPFAPLYLRGRAPRRDGPPTSATGHREPSDVRNH